MADLCLNTKITLEINNLNTLGKIMTLAELVKKHDSSKYCLLQIQ